MVVSTGLHGHSLLLACIHWPPESCTCNFQEGFISFVGLFHLLTLCIISVVISTFMVMYQLVTVINLCPVLILVIFNSQSTYPSAFPCQVAYIPNKVQYRRYHRINISDLCSYLKTLPSSSLHLMLYLTFINNINNMYIIWVMFLTGTHHWYLDGKRKILQIGCRILIDVQSPLDTNLEGLRKGPSIHWTEISFVAKLLVAMHLLTKISQTIIINWSHTIVTTLENYGMCCAKSWIGFLKWHFNLMNLTSHWLTFFQIKLRKLEILLSPQALALKMMFILLLKTPKITAFTHIF